MAARNNCSSARGMPADQFRRAHSECQLVPPGSPQRAPASRKKEASLLKHSVLSCTPEDRSSLADEDHPPRVPSRPPRSETFCAKNFPLPKIQSWPSHREARGFVSLRAHPTSADSIDALVSVHHNTLTIHIQSLPGGAFDKRMASIPVDSLIVTLHPGQFEMLSLSCTAEDSGNLGGDILCYCKDQTARNKWVHVFRRVEGVVVRPLQNWRPTGPRMPQRTPTL